MAEGDDSGVMEGGEGAPGPAGGGDGEAPPDVEGGLTLERYAAFVASLDREPATPAAEALGRLGVPPAAWDEAAAGWTRRMIEEVGRARLAGRTPVSDRYPLALRYGKAYAAAAGELRGAAGEHPDGAADAARAAHQEANEREHGVLAASNAAAATEGGGSGEG